MWTQANLAHPCRSQELLFLPLGHLFPGPWSKQSPEWLQIRRQILIVKPASCQLLDEAVWTQNPKLTGESLLPCTASPAAVLLSWCVSYCSPLRPLTSSDPWLLPASGMLHTRHLFCLQASSPSSLHGCLLVLHFKSFSHLPPKEYLL